MNIGQWKRALTSARSGFSDRARWPPCGTPLGRHSRRRPCRDSPGGSRMGTRAISKSSPGSTPTISVPRNTWRIGIDSTSPTRAPTRCETGRPISRICSEGCPGRKDGNWRSSTSPAGLFDYFQDGMFRRLLKRMLAAVRPGGRLVVGNFSPANPSRPYMHLFDWPLHYRNAEDPRRLAEACGVAPERILIEQEPLGINLFLHILRP